MTVSSSALLETLPEPKDMPQELKFPRFKSYHRTLPQPGKGRNPVFTSCSAVALCPVTRRHMMMCSNKITWNDDRIGLQSSTAKGTEGNLSVELRQR